MTFGIVSLFLIGSLVLVPLGLRLIDPSPDRLAARFSHTSVAGSFPAAVLLSTAFLLPAGPTAGVLATPWLIVAGIGATGAVAAWLHEPDRWRPTPRRAMDIARGFLVVSATFALFDRLGVRPFGFGTTIVLLTAVHFQFAGFVLVLAGSLTWRAHASSWVGVALGAVVVGIPLTALGFFGLPLIAWLGVVLVAIGALGLAVGLIAGASRMGSRAGGRLAIVAGAALFISMPMAVIYSTGLLVGTAWLDIPTMAAIHGTINAVGFAVPAVAAWSIEGRSRS